MAKFHVTLKATLPSGELYWVADVNAGNEDVAMQRAEELFMQALDDNSEWSFSEADAEAL